MSPSIDPTEAARQLAEFDNSNAELARRAVAPWWYHPALGLLVGGMIATMGAPLLWRAVYLTLFFPCLVLLTHVYRRRTGVWVNGFRAGRTRWISSALALAIVAIGLGAFAMSYVYNPALVFPIAGVIAAAVATAAGPLWEAAFRRDLEPGGRA